MREIKVRRLLRWLALAVVCLGSLGLMSYASAATSTATGTQTSNNGLQISPTRSDLAVNPGDSSTFQISIKNVSSIALTAKTTLNDFESDNESGIPRLITDPSKHSPRSIASFLRGLNDVSLKSGESRNIQLFVDVPKNAAPGGYYGAVRFSAIPINQAENVGPRQISLTASVASLVLLEVNGPVNETLTLDSMNALRHSSPSAIFFGKGPDTLAIKLSNKGNGFSQPIGRVAINKGGKEVYSYEFNSNRAGLHSTILPNSSRTFKDPIKNVNSFGQYKIVASIAYKEGDAAVVLSQKFWVIPKAFEIIGLIILALIVGAVILWRFMARRRRTR